MERDRRRRERRRRDDRLRRDRRSLRRRGARPERRTQSVDLAPHLGRRLAVRRRAGSWLHGRRGRVVLPGDRGALGECGREVWRLVHRPGGRGSRRGRAPLEERLELADRTERARRRSGPSQEVILGYLVRENGPLKLSQRHEGELVSVGRLDEPPVTRRVSALGPAHLELVTAARTAHRRPPATDEGVVELVLGLAALALNVHRLVARGACMRELLNARFARRARWHVFLGWPRR